MKAQAALQLARSAARRSGYGVEQVPGRGKGSHAIYDVVDVDGNVVGRFTLTNHPRDVSIGVLRSIEAGLAHLFGEKWMEKR
jgi:predicted RNA binding protein YcfA (HicA-like mRNA interferase family)